MVAPGSAGCQPAEVAFPAAELKAARKRLGLSQMALALELGYGPSTCAGWEQGRSVPTPHNWYLLAAYLNRHDIEFPFPPGEETAASGEWRMANGDGPAVAGSAGCQPAAVDAVASDVPLSTRHSPLATRHSPLAGRWASWRAWRERCKLDGGRWHHRTLATGMQIGLRYNPPFAWELSLEAHGDVLFEGLIQAALDLLFDEEIEVRPAQDDPHFYRAIVRTPELHCAFRDLGDVTEIEALLDAVAPQEAIA